MARLIAPPMTSLASSGSSLSPSAVDPATSAKSAVTIRRSSPASAMPRLKHMDNGLRGRALSQDLNRQLARWQSAGLIDARQAQAIANFEASTGDIPAPSGGGQGGGSDGSITATEVITYAGALVTLAGLGTLLGTQYRQLGVVGRLAIPGLVAIAALLVARALPGERARARRAQTSLVTLAVAAIGLFTGQLQAEILGGPDAPIPPQTGYRIILVAALVSAVLAAVFLMRLRAGLLAAALSVALLVTGIALILRLQLEHGWAVEA